ncbi:MAG: AAA family ATPase [Nitrosospira sp.]
MITPTLRPIDTSVDVDQLLAIDERSRMMLEKVRDNMLAPHPAKEPPIFCTTTLSSLCSIDKARLNYLVNKGDLPPGVSQGPGRSRQFSLAEARQWVKAEAKGFRRPKGVPSFSLVAANFKGGSTKTTTVMTLAQGLTLRGHDVLVIDLDPQASLTSLCGLLPEKDVKEEHTVMPLIYGDQTDLFYAIRQTYWDGLDIIPAAPALFSAEFVIPSQVINHDHDHRGRFQFWNIINNALLPLRDKYDIVLFDTAPALSYLTINALMAGDGMLMPLPPRSLDFVGSTQFWSLFSDLAKSLQSQNFDKKFDFVNILLSRVNSQEAATNVVRDWIMMAYDKMVLPVEIPETSVAGTMAAEFGTVYDVSRWEGSAKTYSRAKQAYDSFVDIMNQKIAASWAARGSLN